MLPKTQVNVEICVNLVLPLMFTYIHRQYKSSLEISLTIFIRFPSVQHECSRSCSPGLYVVAQDFFLLSPQWFLSKTNITGTVCTNVTTLQLIVQVMNQLITSIISIWAGDIDNILK